MLERARIGTPIALRVNAMCGCFKYFLSEKE
jgi:hypothetical protein